MDAAVDTAVVGATRAERTPASDRPSNRMLWLVGFGAWTALALLAMKQSALSLAYRGQRVQWPQLVAAGSLDWYTCALFIPPLLWLVRRKPLERATWPARLPIYLATTLGFAIAKYALTVPLVRRIFGAQRTLGSVLAGNMISEMMIFWAVVGVLHAVEFYRRFREARGPGDVAPSATRRVAARRRCARSCTRTSCSTRSTRRRRWCIATRTPRTRCSRSSASCSATRSAATRGTRRRCARSWSSRPLSEHHADAVRRPAHGPPPHPVRARVGARADVRAPTARGERAGARRSSRLDGGACVEIEAARDGDNLILAVRDNGSGESSVSSDGLGIGLANTRARLAALYGARAELRLTPRPSGGMEAALRLPLRVAPER